MHVRSEDCDTAEKRCDGEALQAFFSDVPVNLPRMSVATVATSKRIFIVLRLTGDKASE